MTLVILKLIFQFKDVIFINKSCKYIFPADAAIWSCSQTFLRNSLREVHFTVNFG